MCKRDFNPVFGEQWLKVLCNKGMLALLWILRGLGFGIFSAILHLVEEPKRRIGILLGLARDCAGMRFHGEGWYLCCLASMHAADILAASVSCRELGRFGTAPTSGLSRRVHGQQQQEACNSKPHLAQAGYCFLRLCGVEQVASIGFEILFLVRVLGSG